MLYRTVEITRRIDNKYNVWAYIPDPNYSLEVQRAAIFPIYRWVVVDVLKSTTEAAKFRDRGIIPIFLLPKAA